MKKEYIKVKDVKKIVDEVLSLILIAKNKENLYVSVEESFEKLKLGKQSK